LAVNDSIIEDLKRRCVHGPIAPRYTH
jgi:hypothetical protein